MVTIRPAVAADVPLILSFVKELAEYERAPHEVKATEADLLRDGFGEHPLFHVLIAQRSDNGEPVGFAFYFFQYSTWTGSPSLHLEDLFVRPEARRLGAGRALLEHMACVAVDRGCKRFQWNVLEWNASAIAFYESLGARLVGDWRTMRIDGDALPALVARVRRGGAS